MTDLMTLLERKGLDPQYVSDQIALECPLCQDHKVRLYIAPNTGLWICHNCGQRGGLISLLERVAKYDPVEAYHLSKQVGGVRKRPAPVVKPQAGIDLPEGYTPLGPDSRDDRIARQYWNYLRLRGIPAEHINGLHFGYTIIGPAAYRVVMPVRQRGETVGWMARAVHPKQEPKLVNAPGMESSRYLYRYDAVVGLPSVVVTEGPFDAWAVPGAVATFGAKLSPLQRIKLKDLTTSVDMMWDTDDAGIEATVKAVPELLMVGFTVRLAIIRAGDDPASAGPERVAKALLNAVPVNHSWSRSQIRRVLEEGRKNGY